jgi:hypothetical protein
MERPMPHQTWPAHRLPGIHDSSARRRAGELSLKAAVAVVGAMIAGAAQKSDLIGGAFLRMGLFALPLVMAVLLATHRGGDAATGAVGLVLAAVSAALVAAQ